MVKPTKDSFYCVYKKYGGFHYPTIISNKVRVKGNLYFKLCEATFVWTYREIIIPGTDELARKLSENERKKMYLLDKKTELLEVHGR